MKLRHPLAIRLVAFLAACLIRAWMSTLRLRLTSSDGRSHPVDPKSARYIYAFWHETLLAPLVRRRLPVRMLISQHADGELIAQVCGFLGIAVVRGSTARGGSQALFELIRGGDDTLHQAFTPDGPLGPRREIKPGIIMAASHSGLPIVPIGIGYTRAWRANSWDRFAVPLPFTTIAAVIGEPITIPRDIDREAMLRHKSRVQSALRQATTEAEDWADRLRQEGASAAPPVVATTEARRKSA